MKNIFIVFIIFYLSGCSVYEAAIGPGQTDVTLTPRKSTYADLLSLPAPKGKIPVSVYSFRDQTGQYKPAPGNNISTLVTQGGTALLIDLLSDSKWFTPVEREGLQNLLTERRIMRAKMGDKGDDLPGLIPASILIEGGIVAYDTNIQTGGAGARYLGIGTSEQYRQDQITVNLRAIDTRTGEVRLSVLTSKTLYSKEIKAGIFQYVGFKELVELESGYTNNEPAQLCVMTAMESALIHLIVQGIDQKLWYLNSANDQNHPILASYRAQQKRYGEL